MTILQRSLILTVLLVSSALWPTLSSAEIYMKFGDLKGDVTAEGYTDQISLDSFQWGLFKSVISGGGGIPETTRPETTGVSLSKQLDKSSTGLAMELLSGKGDGAVKIAFVHNYDRSQEYLTLEFCEVFVTSLSTASGGEIPSENLSLEFARFTLTMPVITPAGGDGGEVKVGWDFRTGKSDTSCSVP